MDIDKLIEDTMKEDSLADIISDIQPNILTPNLNDIVNVKNDKKPKTIAQLLVTNLHKNLKNPVTKDVYHDGTVHKIKYFDVKPLLVGSWSEISLMILSLSYGEQCQIIDAIYPDRIKLTAKAFAINFTKGINPTNIKIENDNELTQKLNVTNAGVCTIISMLLNHGFQLPHPDKIMQVMDNMNVIAMDNYARDKYVKDITNANNANKYKDHLL